MKKALKISRFLKRTEEDIKLTTFKIALLAVSGTIILLNLIYI